MLDVTCEHGTTADIISILRLTPMSAATRSHTIQAVRVLREVLSGGADIGAEGFFACLDAPTPELRAKIGERHAQVLSDVRRARRAWADSARRDLVTRLKGRLPTLSDAIDATRASLTKDPAERTVQALQRLAHSQGTVPEQIVATAVIVEPLLRALAPEDLQARSAKTLSNKVSQIRAAVRLVDPNAVSGRNADVKTLPAIWQELLEVLLAKAPEHAEAVRALFRRLALTADREGLAPRDVEAAFLRRFCDYEIATKSDSHKEKLRCAGRIWNAVIAARAVPAARFELGGNDKRLPDVRWEEVPSDIRARVDALLDRMVSPLADDPWSSLVAEQTDLGLEDLCVSAASEAGAPIGREPGTQRNLRDAVKRVWHAAQTDPAVVVKPLQLEDLFRPDCLVATVGAIRGKRRDKIEAKGLEWESRVKGRYECSLVQALYSVGKSCDLPEDILAPVRDLTLKLDPSIVGKKLKQDGTLGYVYEERKIGKHHEEMLRQFNETSALSRWFGAPKLLWKEAEKWARQGKKAPSAAQASMARSAVISQLEQRVTPMRRSNLARLRMTGAQSHLSLPIGAGEGTLILPAAELKNLRAVYVSIDPETVRMLQRYIAVYRPVFARLAKADPENEHLFPGASTERKERGESGGYAPGFGYMSKDKLCLRFRQHMWKYCQLRMDLQVMRHIAGKVILDMDPSAMGLVQEVLGHKRIETTMSYYAQVCKIVAQKNYLQLLDQYERRIMTNVSFRMEIDAELKG